MLPFLVSFSFLSFRYSMLVSTTPAVASALDALESSLPDSSYQISELGITVDEASVRRNLSHIEASTPMGSAKGSVFLGLDEQDHALSVVAYRCRCGTLCVEEIGRAEINAPEPSLSSGLQRSCSNVFRDRSSGGTAGNDIDCSRTPNQEHVCYGAAVTFAAGLSNSQVASAHVERVNDSQWRNL